MSSSSSSSVSLIWCRSWASCISDSFVSNVQIRIAALITFGQSAALVWVETLNQSFTVNENQASGNIVNIILLHSHYTSRLTDPYESWEAKYTVVVSSIQNSLTVRQ